MRRRFQGFTLAELLISLAILGEIATFTIPKVLSAQADQSSNAKTKEVMGMISGAFTQYQLNHDSVLNMKPSDLTPYMNYVQYMTSGSSSVNAFDDYQGAGVNWPSASYPAVRLANGAIMMFVDGGSGQFSGTASTNAVEFRLDPDGYYSGTTNTGKGILLYLYANGRISTRGNITPNTVQGAGTIGPVPSWDPPWFQL